MAEERTVVILDVLPGNTSPLDAAFGRINAQLNAAQAKGASLLGAAGRNAGPPPWLGKLIGMFPGGGLVNRAVGSVVPHLAAALAAPPAGATAGARTTAGALPGAGPTPAVGAAPAPTAPANIGKALAKAFATAGPGGAAGIGGKVAGPAFGAGINVAQAGSVAGGSGVAGAASALAAAAGPIGVAVIALDFVIDGIKQLGAAALDLGRAASPAAFRRYKLALDDANATMGRIFVPVLELMTDGTRLLGDVMATILPSVSEVREALDPLNAQLRELRDALGGLAPVLKGLVKLTLDSAVTWLRVALPDMKMVNGALRLLGLGGGKLSSSVGASVQPATFQSIDEYSKGVHQAAFSSGSGGGGSGDPKADRMFGYMDAVLAALKSGARGNEQEPGSGVGRFISWALMGVI